ncbi:class II aldolase/adducin family protein [Pseudonocardia sp. GCM10023141]|uniref:class II aldolase/adducin family protein n=1 Tax=Pseudonocardia sp. GCM10023141 TaxID=3252653 RepID=UPI00361136BF
MTDEPFADQPFADQRSAIAEACRVMAARGLADGILGHISMRVDAEHLLVRCRGRHERGLAHTVPDDVRLVDLDGRGEVGGDLGYRVPAELPLHVEVLVRRPDVDVVVHAHPFAVVAADLAGHPIRPLLGAYDIPGAHLAAGGVPVHPRSVLIRTRELAAEMVDSMGERPVVVLRGHGLTATGAGPSQAVLRAISVDTLARMTLAVAAAGGVPVAIPASDLAELPDLGSAFNDTVAWRHELSRLTPAPESGAVPQPLRSRRADR